jgi:hypothetical protein
LPYAWRRRGIALLSAIVKVFATNRCSVHAKLR